MKKLFTALVALVFISNAFAQSPDKMSYQAVVRNSSNQLVSDQTVGMRISILQGTASGTAIYEETQIPTTNANGLVSIEIGGGTVISGTFSTIDWANGPYYLKTETDPTGGTDYTITGTSQLLSVPYALHAKTADNGFSGNYIDLTNLPSNIDEDKTDDVSLTGDQIIGGSKTFTGTTMVPAPVNATDAATKAYVDALKDLIYNELLDAGLNGIVKDIDGNSYKTIKIGDQIWMAENLKYLPSVVGLATGSQTTPYYYVYGYNGTVVAEAKATANYTTYGVLYNWPAAMAGAASSSSNPSGVQGVCPSGWHLPSDAEWTELTDYLGGESVAGGKLKEVGYDHWNSPNTDATDEKGFTALPGGGRYDFGTFYFIGDYGYWWSATEFDASNAWVRIMDYSNASVNRVDDGREVGFSVRCIKD